MQRAEDAGLRISGLTKSFGDRRVLDGVDLHVRPGELVALLGANGSGKSTTLRCAMGLTDAEAGTIAIDGRDLGAARAAELAADRRRTAMIFQKIHLVPRRSALANVCSGGLSRVGGLASVSASFFPRALKEEAMACLDRVGLADRALDRVARLSGGQQQRVAIARALCQRADVLLADEPVSALDPRAAEQIMALLAELAHTEDLAVAAVLHQPDLAVRHADRVLGLHHGRVAFDGPAAEVTARTLEGLYAPDRALSAVAPGARDAA